MSFDVYDISERWSVIKK